MKLGLGTVQFGQDYGISNRRGRTPLQEAERILRLASESGISVLDTAAQYGESEAVLGRLLPSSHRFRIVTKTAPVLSNSVDRQTVKSISETFHRSLDKLRQPSVYGLLIHDADVLFRGGADLLIDEMRSLAKARLVEKIGVSIYTAAQIDRALSMFRPDIVQVPISIFDQRLIESGHLERLQAAGVEVHARSIFLQGLLLMNPADMDPFFAGIQTHLMVYERFLKDHGLSRIEASLSFVRQIQEINVVIGGVSSRQELDELLDAWVSCQKCSLDMTHLALEDEAYLNPLLWRLQ